VEAESADTFSGSDGLESGGGDDVNLLKKAARSESNFVEFDAAS
jgi:hypothetical protein